MRIPELETHVAELIVLILLILAGARLILHDWRLLRSSDRDHLRPHALPQRASRGSHQRGKANPKAELRAERQRPGAPDSAEGPAGIASRGKKVPRGGREALKT